MTQQAIKIYEILKDKQWHCPIEWGYADGHAKRITDINNYLKTIGQEINSDWCDCGRHTARVYKRRIIAISENLPHSEREYKGTIEHSTQELCCPSKRIFGVCARDCQRQEFKIKQLF